MSNAIRYKITCPECSTEYFVVKHIDEEKEPIFCPFCSSEQKEEE